MKKIFLAIGALLFTISSFAQLSLQDSTGTTLINGDTVYVNGMPSTQLSDKFFIYNGNAGTVTTQTFCAPTVTYTHNCTYSICVGTNCYAPVGDSSTFLSPSFSVPTGKYSNMLFTDYNAYYAGVTTILCSVFDKNNPSDSAYIFVKFNASPSGIAQIQANNLHLSPLYPNPASGKVSFTYHTNYNATLDIYNSLGQLVQTSPVNASQQSMSINVDGMPSGIYICQLHAPGAKSLYRRLIVSH